MPTDKDLFTEEKTMVSMSFGDHIEELRVRLILALLGLAVGVVLTFIPPLNLGMLLMNTMQEPARIALKDFYADQYHAKAVEAEKSNAKAPPVHYSVLASVFIEQLHELAPALDLPPADSFGDRTIDLEMTLPEKDLIESIGRTLEPPPSLVSLAPLETVTIFFMVCMVAGLVLASPWVFYQIWAFIAAGLYRHERHYVTKFLPFSLILFLSGVFLCFFGVLPLTLRFLLEFNVWLGIAPTLRLSEWMSFATVLPLVFGACFQTPLVMFFLERIGICTAADYRAKRKFAILIMVVTAAVLTPGPDVFSQLMLAVPMMALYELGIFLVRDSQGSKLAEVLGD